MNYEPIYSKRTGWQVGIIKETKDSAAKFMTLEEITECCTMLNSLNQQGDPPQPEPQPDLPSSERPQPEQPLTNVLRELLLDKVGGL